MSNDKTPAPPEMAPATDQLKLDFSAVRVVTPRDNFLGFANVVINDAIKIDGLRIMQGEKGIYAGMPSVPDPQKEGEYRDIAYPITTEARAALDKGLGEAYMARLELEQSRLVAATAKLQQGYQKPEPKPMKQQIADAKRQAARGNAARAAQRQRDRVQQPEHASR